MKLQHIILSFRVTFIASIILAASLPRSTQAQVSSGLYTYVQTKFGLDQDLVNGIRYFNRYHRVLYHPFYQGKQSLPGSVTVSGKQFDNLMINYDIYNQYVILEYKELSGSIFKVILDPLQISAFQLNGHHFDKKELDENGPLFYEVIGANGIFCYIHWEKQLLNTNNDLDYAQYFTSPSRNYFFDYHGIVHPFSNRRNLVSLFPVTSRNEIRRYLRKNNIRFRLSEVEQLSGLLEFISSNQL